jgi:glutamate decarboxylase
MLAHLYQVPHADKALGTGTTGSSEAIMLAGIAMRRKWKDRRKGKGLPTDKPNLVMGYNTQVSSSIAQNEPMFGLMCRH